MTDKQNQTNERKPKQEHRPHQGRMHRTTSHWSHRKWPDPMIQMREPMLDAIHRYRFLSGKGAARLFFLDDILARGKAEKPAAAAVKAANDMCLKRLKDNGLVEPIPLITTPREGGFKRLEVNVLTATGMAELHRIYDANNWEWKERSGAKVRGYAWQTLSELKHIADIGVALQGAALTRGLDFSDWHDTLDLQSLSKRKEVAFAGDDEDDAVEPDGYCTVFDGERHFGLFVESDRGTESATGGADSTWADKMRRYKLYLRDRHHDDEYFPHDALPLVLTVTTTLTRLALLKRTTEAKKGKTTYWFATEDDLAYPRDAFAPIWHVASLPGVHSLAERFAVKGHLLSADRPDK